MISVNNVHYEKHYTDKFELTLHVKSVQGFKILNRILLHYVRWGLLCIHAASTLNCLDNSQYDMSTAHHAITNLNNNKYHLEEGNIIQKVECLL